MSTTLAKMPPAVATVGPVIHRFTVEDYHRLQELGIVRKEHRVELVNGYLVERPNINPPHAFALSTLCDLFSSLLKADVAVRSQLPVTLADSEPQPDLVLAVPPTATYRTRHPGPADLYLVIEASDSSLAEDRGVKLRMYAAARIPVYWVVNLVSRVVEVYTNPRGGRNPVYRTRTDFAPGTDVPVIAAGKVLGVVSVSEVFS